MPTKKQTALAAPAGSGLPSQKKIRTSLTEPEKNRIFTQIRQGKSVADISRLMRRSENAIYRLVNMNGSARAYAETRQEASLGILQDRCVTEANVNEAMELLHRAKVAGFVRIEKKATTGNTAIAIVQAIVPEQKDMNVERDRVEAIRAGTAPAPVIDVPETPTISIPGLTTVEAPK